MEVIFIVMQLGDLAWDYTDAWEVDDDGGSLIKKMVIVLDFPDPPGPGRLVKVLTMDCVVKRVPVEFLSPVW
jgi:hypothetical protein